MKLRKFFNKVKFSVLISISCAGDNPSNNLDVQPVNYQLFGSISIVVHETMVNAINENKRKKQEGQQCIATDYRPNPEKSDATAEQKPSNSILETPQKAINGGASHHSFAEAVKKETSKNLPRKTQDSSHNIVPYTCKLQNLKYLAKTKINTNQIDLYRKNYDEKFSNSPLYEYFNDGFAVKEYEKKIYDKIFDYAFSICSGSNFTGYFDIDNCANYLVPLFSIEDLFKFLPKISKNSEKAKRLKIVKFNSFRKHVFYPYILKFLFFLDPFDLYQQIVIKKSEESLFDVFHLCSIIQKNINEKQANIETNRIISLFLDIHKEYFIIKVKGFPKECESISEINSSDSHKMQLIIDYFVTLKGSFKSISALSFQNNTEAVVFTESMHKLHKIKEKKMWDVTYQIYLLAHLIEDPSNEFLEGINSVKKLFNPLLRCYSSYLLFRSFGYLLAFKLGFTQNKYQEKGIFLLKEILDIWASDKKHYKNGKPYLKVCLYSNEVFIKNASFLLNLIKLEHQKLSELKKNDCSSAFESAYNDFLVSCKYYDIFRSASDDIYLLNNEVSDTKRVSNGKYQHSCSSNSCRFGYY